MSKILALLCEAFISLTSAGLANIRVSMSTTLLPRSDFVKFDAIQQPHLFKALNLGFKPAPGMAGIFILKQSGRLLKKCENVSEYGMDSDMLRPWSAASFAILCAAGVLMLANRVTLYC